MHVNAIMIKSLALLLCFITVLPGCAGLNKISRDSITPRVDHHQHLFSPNLAVLLSEPGDPFHSIAATDLVQLLDEAGIQRAVVLSTAYIFSQPGRVVNREDEAVRAENDWTSHQVRLFPQRLIGFCSVNPLKGYALEEISRCATDPNLRTGLKLHFANAEVEYHNPDHIERLRLVFRAANAHRMALVVHMRASVSPALPFGRDEALIFLNELLPAAPDVPIQIAHLAGAGNYVRDRLVDPALSVFVDAIAQHDPRVAKLWFDVTAVAGEDASPVESEFLANRIRQLGLERVVYGSDAAIPSEALRDRWKAFRALPLTDDELRAIVQNIAPYLN